MGENVERHATHRSPTLEDFKEARIRELARLNVRLSDVIGEQYHTSEDLKLLEADTEQQRPTDRETVRLWTANSEKYGGGTKSA